MNKYLIKGYNLWKSIGFYALIALILAFFLAPLGWMVLNSFRADVYLREYPPNLLAPLSSINYQLTFSSPRFVRFLLNTFIVSIAATGGGIIIALPAAYSISKIKSGMVPALVLATRMAPAIGYVIPWFILFKMWHLTNTYQGLILAFFVVTVPFSTWLLIAFFRDIPPAYEEAALIDGCSRYTVFFRIVMPMAMPGVVVTIVLNFAACWNSFMIPLVLGGPDTTTLPVFISRFQGDFVEQMGIMFAASTMAVIPVLILTIMFQKHLARGMMGALK